MGVELSKLMMRQYKDGVYRMSRVTVAKHVAQLEGQLKFEKQLAIAHSGKIAALKRENAALKLALETTNSLMKDVY